MKRFANFSIVQWANWSVVMFDLWAFAAFSFTADIVQFSKGSKLFLRNFNWLLKDNPTNWFEAWWSGQRTLVGVISWEAWKQFVNVEVLLQSDLLLFQLDVMKGWDDFVQLRIGMANLQPNTQNHKAVVTWRWGSFAWAIVQAGIPVNNVQLKTKTVQ